MAPLEYIGAPSDSISLIKQQWLNPSDIYSLLLIIGGDIVQKAIAQLAGGPSFITPVAFSFGWVSYSVLAVMAAIGDGSLMPPPDTPCLLINARKGYSRQNHSWILGRILRDWQEDDENSKHALEVSFCTISPHLAGVPRIDFVWILGVAVIFLQCCIAVIPIFLYKDWSIFIITVAGTILSLAQASLPQWKLEKWSCRTNKSDKTICLTQGNGSRRVIVIHCRENEGLNLEDLASPRCEKLASTVPLTIFFCLCWIALLLTAAGLNEHAWYLLGIGSLGTVQNVLAVGAKRHPSAFGFHIKKERFICPGGPNNVENKVMAVLRETERCQPGNRLGLSLAEVYFPGPLHPSEDHWKQIEGEKYAEPDPPTQLQPTHITS